MMLLNIFLSIIMPSSSRKILDLQGQHVIMSPKEVMLKIASSCDDLNIQNFDVYGDFELDSSTSFLRNFESEVADTFGRDDAVFIPSGTMAQQIALLIHSQKNTMKNKRNDLSRRRFACHDTSHLLLWEKDGYKELSGFDAVQISTSHKANRDGLNIPAMSFSDVEKTFQHEKERLLPEQKSIGEGGLTTLIMELPHRELGGKLPEFQDLQKIGIMCKKEGISFHCDGARIFEASAGYGRSLQEVTAPFDSIYISFYKGLGGLAGSMLIGDEQFCREVRIWLRRFGGNLFTLLPFIVSSYLGFQRLILGIGNTMSFDKRFQKMLRVTKRIVKETDFGLVGAFDPPIPHTNMIHVYLKFTVAECEAARDHVMKYHDIQIFRRIRPVDGENTLLKQAGYDAYFEWTMGEANGILEDEVFVEGWLHFVKALQSQNHHVNQR